MDSTNKPTTPIRIINVTIFVDPFEEFLSQKRAEEEAQTGAGPDPSNGSRSRDGQSDDQLTWTGKRVRTGGVANSAASAGGNMGVGRYLKAATAAAAAQEKASEDEIAELIDEEPDLEHARKKFKAANGGGGFGNFDSW